MKQFWFKRLGWVYCPVSWQGILVVLVAAAFCVTVFRAIDQHSHSASDTLYGVFCYYVCTFLLINWVAANTSPTDKP